MAANLTLALAAPAPSATDEEQAYQLAINKRETLAAVCKHQTIEDGAIMHPRLPGYRSLKACLTARKRFTGITVAAAVRFLEQDTDRRAGNRPRWHLIPEGDDVWVYSIPRHQR